MKFSEGLFKIPIRIRDTFSMMKSIIKEDKLLKDGEDIDDVQPEHGDWIVGYARIPVEEIKAWSDTFMEGSDLESLTEKGFTETIVITKSLGQFECMWPMEKFETKLDEFVEKYTAGIDKMVEEALALKAQANEYNKPKKRGFFR